MKAIANEISNKLVQGLDLGNTILGGMTEAYFKHTESDSEYKIEVKTPGLSAENYSIDIKNNVLFIYSLMSYGESSYEKTPYLMRHFTLPYYIDLEGVEADFEDGTLKVTLPYNHFKDGFEKKVEIH